jgi:phenylalanyl-tRNA synthetase beta chain
LALRSNLRQRDRALLFELARVWRAADPSPDERRHVGVAMIGPRSPRSWAASEGTFDYFDVKGVVDLLAASFGVPIAYPPGRHPSLHPGRTAEVRADKQLLGVVGQLHPAVAERFDLTSAPVVFAELDFDAFVKAGQPLMKVETPSRFPPADRDISFFVDESTAHTNLQAAIREAAGDLLEHVELFDVFRGGTVPPGRKSLAFSLRYRAGDRTLEDDEVGAAHGRVEEALRTRFGAEVRGRS